MDDLRGVIERFGGAQLLAVAALVLGAGAAWIAGAGPVSDAALVTAMLVAFLPALVDSAREILRGHLGVDIIALLAMSGALLLGELLAGAIIAVMLTGGEALEAHAAGRARRELTALLSRAPRVAHRRAPDGSLVDVGIGDVEVGTELLVKPGEVVPTDGVLLSDRAILDASALTGESRPVEVAAGHLLESGVVNAAGPIEVRASVAAADSTYAGIVRLVEQAAGDRPPFVRMADRYAAWFLPITVVLAGAAWAISGDPVRALAVLVVATPCPLILAAPAAIVGGLSRAAKGGVIIKGGGALEALARGEVVLLDKTGTVTAGRPSVSRVHPVEGVEVDEVLRLAGCLEQVSVHPFAPAVVAAAVEHGERLVLPVDATEDLGLGVSGRVGEVEVRVGQLGHVVADERLPAALRRVVRRSMLEGSSIVHVSADGRLMGSLVLSDPIRGEATAALRALRRAGITQILMVTGDRRDVAELVAETLGIDRVLAERAPSEKVDAVREASALGSTIMVGDGINDAPALALADVGVAMGARGATAASEAADVVLTSDRLGGLADAVRIAQRTRRIAWQSVVAGMGMSIVAMFVAAAGHLPPVAGALLQEGIDVAVILNALRALRPSRRHHTVARTAVPARVRADHDALAAGLAEVAAVADSLSEMPPGAAVVALRRVRDFLVDDLLPHELEEERTAYPALAAAYDGEDPTATLARSHREISRRIRLFSRLVDEVAAEDLASDEVAELRRDLWTLHAVIDMHVGLEDELYAELATLTGAPER